MPNFRLDRLLSTHMVGPLLRFGEHWRVPRIPILMYHGIQEGAGREKLFREIHITPAEFARQMQYLRSAGYRTVDLIEALAILDSGASCEKTFVITFDDGYRDFYTAAFPVLQSCGFSATVFLITGFMPDAERAAVPARYMNWAEVREVCAHGIRIGSHSVTHPFLSRITVEQIDSELERSKRSIEDKLGVLVDSFAYPYAFPEHDGRFIRHISERLDSLGYRNAVSTIIGSAGPRSNRYLLPRLPMNAHDDPELFVAKVEGSYDWMHAVQSLRKRFRSPFQTDTATVAIM